MNGLTGWKTYTAGAGAILTGLGMIAAAVSKEGGFSFDNLQAGIQTVLAGLAVVGIGHKLDRIK